MALSLTIEYSPTNCSKQTKQFDDQESDFPLKIERSPLILFIPLEETLAGFFLLQERRRKSDLIRQRSTQSLLKRGHTN
jgi:hypothetical protein